MASYLINRDGVQYGPYTEEDFLAYVKSGNIQPADLSWKEDSPEWLTVSEQIQLIHSQIIDSAEKFQPVSARVEDLTHQNSVPLGAAEQQIESQSSENSDTRKNTTTSFFNKNSSKRVMLIVGVIILAFLINIKGKHDEINRRIEEEAAVQKIKMEAVQADIDAQQAQKAYEEKVKALSDAKKYASRRRGSDDDPCESFNAKASRAMRGSDLQCSAAAERMMSQLRDVVSLLQSGGQSGQSANHCRTMLQNLEGICGF